MSRPAGGRLRIALVAAVLVTGCTGIANLNIPTPPNTPPPEGGPTTTVTSDLTGVGLSPVPSVPPTTVVLMPGQASLQGIVTGPSGVVPGATVLVERLVGDSVGGKAVPTQPDGTWKLTGILGGRYRVRAWHAPDLTTITPQILLLGAKDNQNVSLNLTAFNGQSLSAVVSPSPPPVGVVVTLVVLATQQTVGPDGIVRGAPLPGATINVVAAGNVVLAGTNPGITDASGRMTLSLGCASIGPVGLTGTLNSANSFPLPVPDCVVFIPPTTVSTTTTVKPPTSSVP